MMLVAGSQSYGFSIITNDIKVLMEYDQYEINFLGSMGSVGAAFGILPSLFHDYFGPKLTCVVASILITLGYTLTYLSLTKVIYSTYILISIYFIIVGIGASAVQTAMMSTNVKNFEQSSRGKIIGLLTSLFVLSGCFFSFAYKVIFNHKVLPFFLFITIITSSLPLTGAIFLNVIKKPECKPHIIIREGTDDCPDTDDEILHLFPKNKDKDCQSNVQQPDQVAEDVAPDPMIEHDYNPIQMVITLDFWMLIVTIVAGIGGAQLILTNLSSIVLSYGGQDGLQVYLLVAYALASCFGRIPIGFIADGYPNYISRATLLNISILLMGIAMILMSVLPIAFIFPLIILVGFSHGGIHIMMSSLVCEKYGTKFYGVNMSLFNLAAATSSYLIGTLLASKVYQSSVKGSSKQCHGMKCYQLTFIITASICLLSFILGFVLMYRNRGLRNCKKPTDIGINHFVGMSVSSI
ncbi:hypothetical protein AKO1_015543 [Acrasis kona]|uniref:Major facilitator superfamily (MFS) profile domain-containing protein n=1 Tax=Acrasis kona TaxID=1008807 RepID=A0AAW2YYC5_9EUKA